KRGTVHALIGENGAGKSTLMKIVAGIYTPDAGELRLRGAAVHLSSPRQALRNGIAMIHQELNLMPFMSVAENIWIGREPMNACGLISHRELRRRTRALFERFGVDIDPQAEVRTLSMVGRELSQIFPSAPARPGAVVLSARDLTLEPHFYGIGFDLHAGEILGIAGLIGAGRSQLAEALFGLTPASSGRVWIEGCEVKLDSPQTARSRGMAFVTEDRKETGCFLRLSVLENLEIAVLEGDFVRCGFV